MFHLHRHLLVCIHICLDNTRSNIKFALQKKKNRCMDYWQCLGLNTPTPNNPEKSKHCKEEIQHLESKETVVCLVIVVVRWVWVRERLWMKLMRTRALSSLNCACEYNTTERERHSIWPFKNNLQTNTYPTLPSRYEKEKWTISDVKHNGKKWYLQTQHQVSTPEGHCLDLWYSVQKVLLARSPL